MMILYGFSLDDGDYLHVVSFSILVEVLQELPHSFSTFALAGNIFLVPYSIEGHFSPRCKCLPNQPLFPLFHLYTPEEQIISPDTSFRPILCLFPLYGEFLVRGNNIMESNWQYRSYHLIYSHPSGSHLYLGDLASASNLNFLHSHHIRTVITAALGMDHLDYTQMQLSHLLFPLLDAKRPTATQIFQDFYETVERQVKQGNILVHCSAGVSRSPTLVIAYLMRKENWSFKEAIGFIRSRGRKVMPTLGFERQLKAYEGFLRHSSPNGHERKRISSDGRWRSSRMRFTHPQLPNLTVLPLPLHGERSLPLHSGGSFTLSPSAVNNIFATLISRREAATQMIRRQRLISSDSKGEVGVSRAKRTFLAQSSSQDVGNNFQVRRALISQRTSKPKIRSKPQFSP